MQGKVHIQQTAVKPDDRLHMYLAHHVLSCLPVVDNNHIPSHAQMRQATSKELQKTTHKYSRPYAKQMTRRTARTIPVTQPAQLLQFLHVVGSRLTVGEHDRGPERQEPPGRWVTH